MRRIGKRIRNLAQRKELKILIISSFFVNIRTIFIFILISSHKIQENEKTRISTMLENANEREVRIRDGDCDWCSFFFFNLVLYFSHY